MRTSPRITTALGRGLLALCLGALASAPKPVIADTPAPRAAPPTHAGAFYIATFDVAGVKLLDRADVEAAVYPYLGPDRTQDDIKGAVEALQKAYQARGYQTVLVDFPAQAVSETRKNIVRLQVTETPVGRVRVTGARYYSLETVRRFAAALQEGQTPDITFATKEVTELNRLPGRQVDPLLHAGAIPGTVDVDLKVTDIEPLHASLEFSNDHNPDTDPLRLTATVRYDNLWQLGHSVSFTYAVAPTDRAQSEIFAGSYLAPVWNTPFSVLVFGYRSNSNVATLGGTTVLGNGYAIGMRAVDQLPRLGDFSQSLSFGMDYKNFLETLSFAATSTPVPIEYWPIDLAYNLAREGTRFSTKASVAVTAGVPGLGSNTATFENARANAEPEFIHLNLDVTQTERVWHGIEISQHLVGQIADGPLVSSEQFAAGGFQSVRGYLQSEVVGDEGLTGSLEILSPPLNARATRLIDSLRLFAFEDGGAVWLLQPLPGQTRFFALDSAGMGLRLTLLQHLKGDVAVGVPFISGSVTPADRPRVTFSLKSDF